MQQQALQNKNGSQFMHLHQQLHAHGHLSSLQPNDTLGARTNNATKDSRDPKRQGNQTFSYLDRSHAYLNERQNPLGANQALSKSYDHGTSDQRYDENQQQRPISSSVELSAKFSRRQYPSASHALSLIQEEKKRANTLEARRTFYQEPIPKSGDQQIMRNSGGRIRNSAQRLKKEDLETNQKQLSYPMHLSDFNNQCIQEEVEQSCSSQPSQLQYSQGPPSRELISAFDFQFFRSVYSAYNTIWQQVLKLPIYGQNFVRKDDFIRVLKSCKVIQSDSDNVFCSFLLFSCTNHLKQSSANDKRAHASPLLLLDFRLFLKSVFMTLKRQFNVVLSKDGKQVENQDSEMIFHAEMFLVDHFWQYICQSEQLRQPDEHHDHSKDSIKGRNNAAGAPQSDTNATDRNQVESIQMEILQRKLFEFFDRRQPPYLLQISEIEMIVTECFKNLIERNKRKDMISKRTFKKVISRQCPGILCKALTAFIPGGALQNPQQVVQQQQQMPQADVHSNLVPFSLPLSSPITDSGRAVLIASGPQQPKSYGMVIDHHLTSNRQRLEPRSVPRSSTQSHSNHNSTFASQQNHRDQKSTHQEQATDQNEQRPRKENMIGAVESSTKNIKDDRKSKSLPPTREQRRNLCKQLETKIVVQKLQSVLDSYRKRQTFALLEINQNPQVTCPDLSDSSSDNEQQTHQGMMQQHQDNTKLWTRSSDSIEMPIEKSPTTTSRREKHIIPVQQLNQIRSKKKQNKIPRHDRVKTQEQQLGKDVINEEPMHRRGSRAAKSNQISKAQAQFLKHQTLQNSSQICSSSAGPANTQACTCCDKNTSTSNAPPHLVSYQDQPMSMIVAEIGASSSEKQQPYQITSLDTNSNYQTSCFQNTGSSQDQKGLSRKKQKSKKEKLRNSQDISDQKLPGDSSSVGPILTDDQSRSENTTGRTEAGETSAMLKNILKHETQNHQCLQELVYRVQSLEQSSKVQQRKEEFQQVQNLKDFMQMPEGLLSPTDTGDGATMTFQPVTSETTNRNSGHRIAPAQLQQQQYSQENCYGQSLQQMYDQGLPLPAQIDSTQEQVSMSKQSSQNEFSHRHPDQEVLLQIAQQQLEQARNQLAELEAQGINGQYRSSGHTTSLNSQSISQQQQSQDVDLCGSTAEGYCHEQFYEKSKDEDRVRQGDGLSDYGDEMDFEANKEQRPLQIINQHQGQAMLQDLSGGSSCLNSQEILQSKQTLSDPYINTNIQSIASNSNFQPYENNPYVMTSVNSQSRSGISQQQYAKMSHKNLLSNSNGYRSMAPLSSEQLRMQAASLSYTISEENTEIFKEGSNGGVSPPNRTIVTSAPNLQVVSASVLPCRKEQLPEKPYSNRLEIDQGVRPGNYDSHDYVESEKFDQKGQQQSPSVEMTSEQHDNTASQELIYLRKYKKVKKQLKQVIREKRDLEDRTAGILNDNTVLQEHLDQTAKTAQEVSNHNSSIVNELHVQKVVYALRSLTRFKLSFSYQSVNQVKRKALLIWQMQSMKAGFLNEQTQQQELILSELSRHESDFKGQLVRVQQELIRQKQSQRVKMLQSFLLGRQKQLSARALAQWRANLLQHTERESTLNLQEDLSEVVSQLNQFRITLVFTKLQSVLKTKLAIQLCDAFKSIQGHENQKKIQKTNPVDRPPQYKSPFMQHITKNLSQSFTVCSPPQQEEVHENGKHQSIGTIVNHHNNSSFLSKERPSADRQYKRQKSSQSIEQQQTRSHSTSQAMGSRNTNLILSGQDSHYMKQLASANDTGRNSQAIDIYEVHDDRPMAPRQKPNQHQPPQQIQRSKSDNRPSKKQEFSNKMGDRMQKIRQQGQQVEGLVKLHAIFTQAHQRTRLQSRQVTFTVLLNYCISARRSAANQEKQKREVYERQSFPVTTTQYRSVSHNPPNMQNNASMAAISQSDSNSASHSRYAGISSFKISTSSLQLGSQINRSDTILETKGLTNQNNPDHLVPREKPPVMIPQQNQGHEYPNLKKLRERRQMLRHLRSGSENQLEPPRIMMGMSPSMHNISGPELVKSSSTMQFTQDGAKIGSVVSLKNRRSSIPKPNRWKP